MFVPGMLSIDFSNALIIQAYSILINEANKSIV